ncbi:MAG: type II CAAX endopeptidase family protein [Lachnospiraceae bacterium]
MNNQHEVSNEFSKVGMTFAVLTVFVTIIQFIFSYIFNMFFPIIIDNNNYNLIISTALLYIPAIPILYFGLRLPDDVKPTYQTKKMSIKSLLKFFCMTYFLLIASNIFGLFITDFLSMIKGSMVENPVYTMFDGTNIVLMFILSVILAPLFEEFFFRKMLIDRVVKYGERTSIILSGLVFGLFHGNLNQFMYAFVIGIFFGYVYIRTGKIIYPIILHAMVNFMGSVASVLVVQGVDLNALPTDFTQIDELLAFFQTYGLGIIILLFYELAIFILVILGLVFFIQSCKKFYIISRESDIPDSEAFRTVMFNKGMICYSIIWIIFIVIQILE